MDFLQNEKGRDKDECKLVAFCTRRVRECGCVKCGRISLTRRSLGKCTFAAHLVARDKRIAAWKRRNVWNAEQVKHLPPPPITHEECW